MNIVKRVASAVFEAFKTGAAILSVSALMVGIGMSAIYVVRTGYEANTLQAGFVTIAVLMVMAIIVGGIMNLHGDK